MSGLARARVAALAAGLLAALGCALPPPAPVDAERVRESELDVLANVRRLRGRLFHVGYTLRAAAGALCQPLLPDAAVLLGARDAEQNLAAGLEVLYVVPGSPLALAGVQPGDIVLEVDGRSTLDVPGFNAALPAERPATFTLRRGAGRYRVSARIATVCGVPVQFSEDTGLMTFQRGSSVAVPYGLLEADDHDDWLAIAIAHQIAHVLIGFATQSVDDPEAVADHLGLLLAHAAGFDIGKAPDFWTWLASENPWRIPSSRAFGVFRPHPTLPTEVEYSAGQLHLGIGHRLPPIRARVLEILAAPRSARVE